MSKKLLLADDSITIQKVIGITFANEDFELSVVDNGDSALEKARSMTPDLILADVFMPGKNGYELCAAVRQDPALRNIPVLLLTGTFEPFDENKARSVGADSWIAKPFESQALIDRVEELLARIPEPAPAAAAPVAVTTAPEPPAPSPVLAAPAPDADIWGDLADAGDTDLMETASTGFTFADSPAVEMTNAADALPADEDIWGDVSFDEEDLLAGEADSEVAGDIWGSIEEEPAIEAPSAVIAGESFTFADEDDSLLAEAPAAVSAVPAAVEEFIFAEEDEFVPPVSVDEHDFLEEEILHLEELEILEEEDLETVAAATAGESFLFAEEVEPALAQAPSLLDEPDEVPVFADESLPGESSIVFDEKLDLVEEGPEWGIAEEPLVGIEPTPQAVEEYLITAAEAAQAAEPVTPPMAAAVVEERVRAFSEEELAQIVERVAGSVIERLAGTVLERIVWEVVPDLAESLVREEIRKIRQEA